jgi:DNA-binding protein H-NS
MPSVDFKKFDLNQLKELSRKLADEIEQRTEEERERAALEIKRIANSLGLTVEEIMAGKKAKRGRKPKSEEHVFPTQLALQGETDTQHTESGEKDTKVLDAKT